MKVGNKCLVTWIFFEGRAERICQHTLSGVSGKEEQRKEQLQ